MVEQKKEIDGENTIATTTSGRVTLDGSRNIYKPKIIIDFTEVGKMKLI